MNFMLPTNYMLDNWRQTGNHMNNSWRNPLNDEDKLYNTIPSIQNSNIDDDCDTDYRINPLPPRIYLLGNGYDDDE